MQITHNNKTYRPKKYSTDLFFTLVESYIKSGDLEEVKENKEYSSINEFCVLNGVSEEHRAMLNAFLAIEHTKANRILEKLREELDKMKTENTDTSDEYTQWVLNTCGYLLDLLTSLEQPKEQPQPQEDIELLPKFDEYLSTTECIKLRVFSLEVQVELLTSTVNQLIKANK